LNQHGLLKLLQINNYGTFIDGIQISEVTLSELNLNYKSSITLKLAVPEKSKYMGGLTLFGESFGNYSQGIHVRILYQEETKGHSNL
jgi:predicted transcriptional regulator